MKIVVVEDEPRTREGIMGIIRGQSGHDVASASRAETGLALILRDPPDLVITDIKMGDMDGLAMLEAIRSAGIACACVILTGYSSFEYARQAIHLRVTDYLLKPVMADELLECLDKIDKGRDSRVENASPEELLLRQLTDDSADPRLLADRLRYRHEIDADAQHMLALFQLKSVDRESFSWASHRLREGISMLCLENVLIAEIPSQQCAVLLMMQTERNGQLEQNIEKYILPSLLEEVRCLCMARRFTGLTTLRDALRECRAMRPYSLLIPEGRIITQERVRLLPNRAAEYPEELERKLKRAIGQQDGAGIRALCAELKGELFSGRYRPESVTDILTRIMCNACVTAEEQDPELKGAFHYNRMMQEIGGITSGEDLAAYFDRVMDQIQHHKDGGPLPVSNLTVSRVIGEIQKKYMEEISLSALAKSMDLTPEYLSGLFSREMGINFCAFLKNFRISHAKRLIEGQSIKIQEVAQRVGFNDPKYFNRVFKEICGVSPSEYRALHRRAQKEKTE